MVFNMVYEIAIKTSHNADFSKWREEVKITTIN